MYISVPSFRRDKTARTGGTNNASAVSSSSAPAADHLAPLTSNERTLLRDNEGCFKCRVPFADHLSPQCPTGFPDARSYKPLTENDIALAKRQRSRFKPSKVATVIPTNEEPAVPAAVVMPMAVLGNGLDSECVEAPFSSPHFFANVIIGGSSATSHAPVHALIDHGCDTVLTSPELADGLGLTQYILPKPKVIVMAVEGAGKEEIVFREYVKMTVISSDQSWSSRSCKAIIAPNLCAPLILGNAFLTFNHFVLDHELRTCIDKSTGFDLLNPVSTPRTIVKPKPRFGPELKKKQKAVVADIKSLFPRTRAALDKRACVHEACPIAAVRTRIKLLVTQEQLRLKDAEFKERYLDLFPPDIPDVSKLPDDV
jgi:hypothetical protein